MGSPEDGRPSATSPPDSSVQESPFLRYLSSLTPINSAPYTQRVLGTNLPATPSVFASPQIDQQRGTHLLRRIQTDAVGSNTCQQFDSQLNSVSVPWSRSDFQSCSPSGHTEDYLAEPIEVDQIERARDKTQFPGGSDTVPKVVPIGEADANHDTTQEAGSTLLDDFEKNMPLESLDLIKYLGESEGLVESNIFARHRADQESAQQQLHGIRRHLQFEAAVALNNGTNFNCCSSSKMHVPVPSHLETRGVLRSMQKSESLGPPSSSFQDEYVKCKENGGNLDILVPFTCCVGIHLNNIARSESVSSAELTGKQLLGHLSSQKANTTPQIDHSFPVDLARSSITRSQQILGYVQNANQESQALVPAGSEPYNTEAVGDRMHLPCIDLQDLPSEGRIDPKGADEIEELSQNSAKRSRNSNYSRKKLTYSSNSEECKRCNCKRSKCLKLYCDCFAAGVYCVDSCACENCMNKPEYEDTVLDTRHQIELRNPLAFTPKIVETGSESLANVVENRNWTTPSSARHKRGCNCKKSKCLKKYCECYQAKVGCSDGCRCEDCKNSFGKKQGFAEPMFQTTKRLKYLPQKKDSAEAMSDSIKNDPTNQLAPTFEEFVDITQGTEWFNPQSKVLASSFDERNHNQTGVQSCKGSGMFSCSAIKASCMTPQMLKENCEPNDAMEAGSSNQKVASQNLDSSTSFSQNRRKFILQAVPSFPPLTP